MSSQIKSDSLYLYTDQSKLLDDLRDLTDYEKMYLVDYDRGIESPKVVNFDESQYAEFSTIIDSILEEVKALDKSGKSKIVIAVPNIGPIKDYLSIFPSVCNSLKRLIIFCEFFNVKLYLFKDKFNLKDYSSKFYTIF